MLEKENKKLFISSALPYVNSPPHIGFALEIVQADAIARYNRFVGRDVFFLTGSDENSLKNVRAAEKEGISIQEFVDRNAQKFKDLKELLNLSFDDFIRTTEDRHIKGVQKLWQRCFENGDLYLGEYEGLYCVGCEAYLTQDDLENGLCPEHKATPEQIKEKNWFFKLSKYQNQIQEAIEGRKLEIVPESRRNEVLSFLQQELKDICVSRSNERAKNWGISVPGDDTQKIWCWFDALGNYITALGYGSNEEKFERYWQKGEVLHVIGKGISRFHAVYWLGILLSAGLKLPDKIFVHGYITADGQKMSKSLGNVVNPFELIEKYAQKIGNKEAAIDAVRYFLLREISPTGDGDFTIEKFENRYNSDLAKGLGNLTSRIIALALRTGSEAAISRLGHKGQEFLGGIKKQYKENLDNLEFSKALENVWQLVSFCDKYIDRKKPWEREGSDHVISNLLILLAEIAGMLVPFLPGTSKLIFKQLGIKDFSKDFSMLIIEKGDPLFPRLNS